MRAPWLDGWKQRRPTAKDLAHGHLVELLKRAVEQLPEYSPVKAEAEEFLNAIEGLT